MILLIVVLILAFCYAAFVGFSMVNFVIGTIIAVLVLGLLPQIPRTQTTDRKMPRNGRELLTFVRNAIHFLYDFVVDLTVSNLELAWEVWTLTDHYDPQIVYVPVKDLSDLELVLLSSRITLTPGTLSADVTADREHLVVHVMFRKGEDEPAIARRLRAPIELLRRKL
jgi:multicomponent Na+:H+ antiporter subunit E